MSVAAAVVDDRGRVLAAQRRDNAHWEPPAGPPAIRAHDGRLLVPA